jgi:hypothetical protein
MAKQKIDMDSRLDDLERGIAFLIDQAQPVEQPAKAAPRKPAEPGRARKAVDVVLSWIVLILVVAATAALVSSIWLDRQKPADSAQAQAQPIATIPAGYQQPAYNPAPAPAAEQPIIAQPDAPQPAQVAEPVAPVAIEARPTSEQYIVQDGQFVLAAEPAPTPVPGSAGPGGSSGGSTWGNP